MMQLQLDSALTPLCRSSLRVQFMDKTFVLMWIVDFKAHLASSQFHLDQTMIGLSNNI
jgi:hypothetical protein